MSSSLPATTDGADIMEAVITRGDLAKLSPQERSEYYAAVCRSIGLNPLTKPFDYLTLSGKLVLYATRTATDQLRRINGVSITSVERDLLDGVLMVTATAQDKSGRVDTEIGAVNVAGLKGDALANAYMKALTKAKRRVTLSICGLGWMDESEVESVPAARRVTVDADGVIQDAPQTPQDAPGRMETRSPWNDAVQIAEKHHIAEESLCEYFAARCFDPPDVPGDILAKFAVWCGSHTTAQVQAHLRDVISQSNQPPAPPSAALLAEAAAEPAGMDDEDYQQVVASINAGAASESMSAAEAAERWTR